MFLKQCSVLIKFLFVTVLVTIGDKSCVKWKMELHNKLVNKLQNRKILLLIFISTNDPYSLKVWQNFSNFDNVTAMLSVLQSEKVGSKIGKIQT